MAEADVSLKNALPFGAVGLFFCRAPQPCSEPEAWQGELAPMFRSVVGCALGIGLVLSSCR